MSSKHVTCTKVYTSVFDEAICDRENAYLRLYLEDLEGAHEGLVDGHHGTGVVELATVVGRRKKRDQLSLGEEFVAVLHHLRGKGVERRIPFNTMVAFLT